MTINFVERIAAEHREIDEVMPIERWRAAKAIGFALLTVGFSIFMASVGAEPTVVFVGAVFLIALFYGLEANEVEIAKWLTINFRDTQRSQQRRVDERGRDNQDEHADRDRTGDEGAEMEQGDGQTDGGSQR